MNVDNVSGINQPDQTPNLGSTQGDDDSTKTTDTEDTPKGITYDDINDPSFAPSITDYLQMLQKLQDLLDQNPPSSDDEKNIQDLLNALQQKVSDGNPLHLSTSSLNDLENIINNPNAINCSDAIKNLGQVNENFNATLLKLVQTESEYFEGEIGELYSQLNLSSQQQEIINSLMSYVTGMPVDLGNTPEEQAENIVKINNIMYSMTHATDGGESMLHKLNDMLNGQGGLNDLIAQLQADLKENPKDADKKLRLSQMTALQEGLDGIYQELKGLSDQGLGQKEVPTTDISKITKELEQAAKAQNLVDHYNNLYDQGFDKKFTELMNDLTHGCWNDLKSAGGIIGLIAGGDLKIGTNGLKALKIFQQSDHDQAQTIDSLLDDDTFTETVRKVLFSNDQDLSVDDMKAIVYSAATGNEAQLDAYCDSTYGALTPETQYIMNAEDVINADYNKTDSGDGDLVKLSNLPDLLRNAKDEVSSASSTANNSLNQKEMEWSQVMQTISNLISSFAQIALDIVKKPM